MGTLRLSAVGLLVSIGLVIGVGRTNAVGQSSANTVEAHVAAAKVAAGREHTTVFNNLCKAPAPAVAAPQAQQAAAAALDPPRSQWHAEPAKVFDNLYYLGQTEYTAWAVTTSEGIIVVDTLFDYSVEDEIVNGLTKLGLDPSTIRYVLVSHGHIDHVGGAWFLQERFSARVI